MTFLCPGLPRSFTRSQSSISSRLPLLPSHTLLLCLPQSQAPCLPTLLLLRAAAAVLQLPTGHAHQGNRDLGGGARRNCWIRVGEAGPGATELWEPTPDHHKGESWALQVRRRKTFRASPVDRRVLKPWPVLSRSESKSLTVGLTAVSCLSVCKHCVDWRSLLISSLCV